MKLALEVMNNNKNLNQTKISIAIQRIIRYASTLQLKNFSEILKTRCHEIGEQ